MLGVGDDPFPIGELDFEAWAAGQHVGRRHDPNRPTVSAKQEVADGDLAHGRPSEGRRQRCVEGQRLADARPGRDDHHLPRVQTIGQRVQIGETRWHTGRAAPGHGDRVDLVHGRLQQLLEDDVVLAGAPLGDVIDLRLRAIDDLVDLAAADLPLRAPVPELHDARAGLDQAPQDRLLGDDLRVVAGVCRGRHARDEGVQVHRAADPAQRSGPLQLRGHRDRVRGLAARVQIDDRVEDERVGRLVEVCGPQRLHHVGDRILGQQHAAQHRLLRIQILRRLPVERGALGGADRRALPALVDDRHPSASPWHPGHRRHLSCGHVFVLTGATDRPRTARGGAQPRTAT